MAHGTAWSWLLVVTSLLLLAFPRRLPVLVLYTTSQLCFHVVAEHLPWNHGLFMSLTHVALLLALVRAWWSARRRAAPDVDPEEILANFAPAARLSLILLYAFAFLHKLNADFLDPDHSCAGWLLGLMDARFRILPTGEWLTNVGIWSTLIVESVVPLLLCFRRTIGIAIVLGFGFHLFISQIGGLYGFAAVMYAVYFLFLPARLSDEIAERFEEILRRPPLDRWLPRLGIALSLAIFGTVALARLVRGWRPLDSGVLWWDLWLVLVLVAFGRPLLRALLAPDRAPLSARWAPMWIVPALVFLSGSSPYLGLKTETAWSMFSNLRTEIRPNHFFLSSGVRLGGWQDDLVKIVETSVPDLERRRAEGARLTFFELRRTCSALTGDFRVVYERNGERYVVDTASGVADDPLATRPHP